MSKVKKSDLYTEEQQELIADKADDAAKELGYEDAQDLVDSLRDAGKITDVSKRAALERVAGDFVTKLQPVLYQQRLLSSIGTKSIYNWINKFRGENLTWGNEIVFAHTYLTNAGNYKMTDFIPSRITGQKLDTYKAQWIKNDGTLTNTSYRYKKSLSLQPNTWLPYFQSGKLNEVIANITAEMEETYTMFIAYTIQQALKNLVKTNTQVALDASGINGENCRLKEIVSTAPDTFQAMLDLTEAIYNLTKDSNKLTIASDSANLRAVDMSDLVIFIPKPLIAKFQSGILTRLPSAENFNYEQLFNSERVVPIGAEISPIKKGNANSDEQQDDAIVDLVAGATPFITGDNKIIVIERRAIQHWKVLSQTETQFYSENLITQLTDHEWGFTFVLPFAKGFVFKCDNLLTDPSAVRP